MSKREFLMLAHDFVPHKHGYFGYYMSRKLDGMRAYWDGGVSRGMSCDLVPWANTAKHGRFKTPQIATGLWTRYGQPIQAPAFWLDTLPKIPLDGELICGDFENTVSVCKTNVNLNPLAWRGVDYWVFDIPPYNHVFYNSEIKGPNYKKTFRGILDWLEHRGVKMTEAYPFYKANAILKELDLGYAKCLPQEQTPTKAAKEYLEERMAQVRQENGEGLMLRSSVSFWRPERSHNLLKVKVFNDMEGTVIGYKWGKETDVAKSISGEVTNRLVGLMGSLRVRLDSGKEFDLASGFTLEQRKMRVKSRTVAISGETINFQTEADLNEGLENPGTEVSLPWENELYPRGSKITFRYRELTNEGMPKEARFLRTYVGV